MHKKLKLLTIRGHIAETEKIVSDQGIVTIERAVIQDSDGEKIPFVGLMVSKELYGRISNQSDVEFLILRAIGNDPLYPKKRAILGGVYAATIGDEKLYDQEFARQICRVFARKVQHWANFLMGFPAGYIASLFLSIPIAYVLFQLLEMLFGEFRDSDAWAYVWGGCLAYLVYFFSIRPLRRLPKTGGFKKIEKQMKEKGFEILSRLEVPDQY